MRRWNLQLLIMSGYAENLHQIKVCGAATRIQTSGSATVKLGKVLALMERVIRRTLSADLE